MYTRVVGRTADEPSGAGSEPELFISYRRSDARATAGRLHQSLCFALGDGAAFQDTADSGLGVWPPQILKALTAARVVLAVIGPQWLTASDEFNRRRIDLEDDWVRRELIYALQSGQLVVPVLVNGCLRVPPPEALPHALIDLPGRSHVVLRHDHWTQDFEQLLRLLRQSVDLPSMNPRALHTSRPTYTNDRDRRLGEQLEVLYEDRAAAVAEGRDTEALNQQILAIRREQRSGPQLVPGTILADRYRLDERLGSGGFATVWAAYDTHARILVAVKVLHGQYASGGERADRFLRGARMMQTLAHPHVVRVLEPRGEDGGYPFFVMELLSGGDLRTAIDQGRLSPKKLLDIIEQVAEALSLAHRRNPPMVHRDVKPANILLTIAGEPKLTDFDLVRAGDTTGGTRTGALGTFLYAAPEAMKEANRAGPAADVYGLAMTAAVGLRREEPEIEAKFRPTELVLPVEPAIAAVLRSALSVDPNSRPKDAGIFLAALREARRASEPRLRPADPDARRSLRWREALVVTAISVALAALVMWFGRFNESPRPMVGLILDAGQLVELGTDSKAMVTTKPLDAPVVGGGAGDAEPEPKLDEAVPEPERPKAPPPPSPPKKDTARRKDLLAARRRRAARARVRELVELGKRLVIAGNFERAERVLMECLGLDAKQPDCHRNLGILYAQQDQTTNAIKHYRRYIELRPGAGDASRVREILRRYKRNP